MSKEELILIMNHAFNRGWAAGTDGDYALFEADCDDLIKKVLEPTQKPTESDEA